MIYIGVIPMGNRMRHCGGYMEFTAMDLLDICIFMRRTIDEVPSHRQRYMELINQAVILLYPMTTPGKKLAKKIHNAIGTDEGRDKLYRDVGDRLLYKIHRGRSLTDISEGPYPDTISSYGFNSLYPSIMIKH